MKRYIFFLLLIFNFSINAETYKCKLKNNQNIVFDRSGHSHFKKCIDKICDKSIYPVIHLDKKFLIFGNINRQNEINEANEELINNLYSMEVKTLKQNKKNII